jgi:hypothetical protein
MKKEWVSIRSLTVLDNFRGVKSNHRCSFKSEHVKGVGKPVRGRITNRNMIRRF